MVASNAYIIAIYLSLPLPSISLAMSKPRSNNKLQLPVPKLFVSHQRPWTFPSSYWRRNTWFSASARIERSLWRKTSLYLFRCSPWSLRYCWERTLATIGIKCDSPKPPHGMQPLQRRAHKMLMLFHLCTAENNLQWVSKDRAVGNGGRCIQQTRRNPVYKYSRAGTARRYILVLQMTYREQSACWVSGITHICIYI